VWRFVKVNKLNPNNAYSRPIKKSPGDITGAKATSLKTISKPTRAGQLDASAQRQSDGLATG
jgi:hypothetical protein